MVNANKIKGRMRELGITQADVAKFLNVAQPTVNQKINNIRPFDLDEAEKFSNLLGIDTCEFGAYFLLIKLQNATKKGGELNGQAEICR